MVTATKGSVEAILASAQKKYNLRVGSLSAIAEDVLAISTGNLAIDNIIGVGGVPIGRLIELYGPQSSGKTTTALQAAAELQRIIIAGGDSSRGISASDRIIYLDYEHAMDPEYCKKLGLNTDHESFLFTQPDSLEDGANFVREIVPTGAVRLIIFDSVAAMVPSAKSEAEVGKSLPAVQAKLMSDFLAPLVSMLHTNNCTAIFLNHIFEVMEMRRPGMAPRTSTPGGRALKFYASVRIEYKQIGNIKTSVVDAITQETIEQISATNVRVKVVKNKVAAPFREAVVRVRFGKGFDNFWTALQILVAHKSVMYSTGMFYFHKVPELAPEWMPRASTGTQRPYLKGEKALFGSADKYPEWRDAVIAKAYEVVNADPSALDAITKSGATESEEESSEDSQE